MFLIKMKFKKIYEIYSLIVDEKGFYDESVTKELL